MADQLQGRRPVLDRVDQLIGVCGGTDDSDVLQGPVPHAPPPARCGEVLTKGGLPDRHPPVDIRRAVLTRT